MCGSDGVFVTCSRLSGGSGSKLYECSGRDREGKDGGIRCGSDGGTSVFREMTLSSSAQLSSHSQLMVGLQAWERTSGFFSAAGLGVGMGSDAGAAAGADVTGASS